MRNLGIQFLLAVVSGGVAGLIAGWVLMRWQLRAQLASDDLSKVIDILHSLERVRENMKNAEMAVLFRKPAADKGIQAEINVARQSLAQIASQAQYLRSRKHRLLRSYLVLRIKRGYISNDVGAFGHSEMGTILEELIEDLNEYSVPPPGFALKRAIHYPRSRLPLAARRCIALLPSPEEPQAQALSSGLCELPEFVSREWPCRGPVETGQA